jgi:molybdopterin synthase sulfur carrier subunit
MKINFYATLRDIVGGKTVEFDLTEDTTVRQLVDEIVTTYPQMRPVLLNEEGHLYGHVHVFINGRDAPYLENALDTKISQDDSIDVFPAVGGG